MPRIDSFTSGVWPLSQVGSYTCGLVLGLGLEMGLGIGLGLVGSSTCALLQSPKGMEIVSAASIALE